MQQISKQINLISVLFGLLQMILLVAFPGAVGLLLGLQDVGEVIRTLGQT